MLCARSLVLKPACLLARGLRQHAKPALSGAGCWSAAALRPPATALVQHSASSNIGILTRALSSLRVCDGANTQLRGTQDVIYSTQNTPEKRELSTQAATAVELPPNLTLADRAVLDTFLAPQPPSPEVEPPTTFDLSVHSFANIKAPESAVGTVSLDPRVFGVPIRRDIIHQVVTWQRAKARQGTAATLRVGEIRGSTKKARQQKGSGMARAGKKRAPQWNKGYKPHGPRARDFSFKLNKKVRALGLRVALSAKFLERNIIIVDNLQLTEAKTKLLASIIRRKDWGRTLLIDDELDTKVQLAAGNLQTAHVLPQIGANVLDIVRAQTLVLTQSALEALTERLTRGL